MKHAVKEILAEICKNLEIRPIKGCDSSVLNAHVSKYEILNIMCIF